MKRMDTTEHLYTPDSADKVAASMRDADPDWTYIVKHDPKGTGYSFVEIYDEDNTFVGKL
jgi:hypothetical protein